ncbi:hypothetical protein JAAARDRAFT_51542 [Jaapia argillacea MUCL 33604]|uniref:Uncharacterized protein n=1 Tax=Jaapia argillacea MUCL 33604 TaxID=933084 RepID=A0A067P4M1_9AGAM|nr:hypothetical protein JAAARDRAFT_51542 [Jaapia argillacea MUCL 33604]
MKFQCETPPERAARWKVHRGVSSLRMGPAYATSIKLTYLAEQDALQDSYISVNPLQLPTPTSIPRKNRSIAQRARRERQRVARPSHTLSEVPSRRCIVQRLRRERERAKRELQHSQYPRNRGSSTPAANSINEFISNLVCYMLLSGLRFGRPRYPPVVKNQVVLQVNTLRPNKLRRVPMILLTLNEDSELTLGIMSDPVLLPAINVVVLAVEMVLLRLVLIMAC